MSGTRRGNGEGTILKRRDGRWVATITEASGTRKSYYAATRQEVQARLNAALKDVQDGLPLPRERQSTETFLRAWLDGARSTVRPSTWARYDAIIRTHAIPNVGRVPLARLGPQHLQRLYADRLEAKAAPASVHQLHAVLHRALEDATRWRHVARNVASLVKPPRVARTEMRVLSAE